MAKQNLNEAATVRSRARAAARALKELLKDKAVPAELRKQVENLHASMGKTWSDLEADAKLDPERESAGSILQQVREAANMGDWFEAMLHLRFTEMADYAFAEGRLTRDERIAVSGAIGDGLDAFHLALMQGAVQLYGRNPWDQPKGPADVAMNASEADAEMDLQTEYVPLVERSVRQDGTIPVKIIQPGWGATGYYPADMLERNASKFKAGTKMYWNHPTPTEERERPERDLRDLAAELVTDARWVAQGPGGAGLYAEAKVFDAYKPAVDELGPHIGVSIRALGKASVGIAEGKTGKLINEISQVGSVDFVTSPGAGGKILQIFEAARQDPARLANGEAVKRSDADKTKNSSKEDHVNEEMKALQEANAALKAESEQQKAILARLNEAQLLREAGDFVSVELTKVQLPQVTKDRLVKQLVAVAPIKENRIDLVTFTSQIAEAVKAEQAYLSEAVGAGRITGFGATQPADQKPEQMEADLVESFRRMGLSDEAAKQAALGHGGAARGGK